MAIFQRYSAMEEEKSSNAQMLLKWMRWYLMDGIGWMWIRKSPKFPCALIPRWKAFFYSLYLRKEEKTIYIYIYSTSSSFKLFWEEIKPILLFESLEFIKKIMKNNFIIYKNLLVSYEEYMAKFNGNPTW